MTRRSLRYVFSFAALGLLLSLWGILFRFAPLESPSIRQLFETLSFETPLIWLGVSGVPLLLWPFVMAGIYGITGFVLGRALRRLPPKQRDPDGHKLTRRFIFYFAAVGYLLPVWFYGVGYFGPLGQPFFTFIYGMACPTCAFDAHPRLGAFFFAGPINAAFLGFFGWVIGRAFRRGPSPGHLFAAGRPTAS